MATTDMGRTPQTGARSYDDQRDDGDRRDGHDRGVKMLTSTETRRAFGTTEFWITLAAAVAVIIAGYWDEGNLRINLAWSLGIGLVAAYVLSRGIAKAGLRDPQIRDLS